MKILALLIWPTFFIITPVLFNKAGLVMSSFTYSNLGSHHKYGRFFNLLLITCGIIQLLFLVTVFNIAFPDLNLAGRLGLNLLQATALAGIFDGIITEKMNYNLHLNIAKVGFIFSLLGYLLFGLFLLPQNSTIGLFMLLWGLVVMPFQAHFSFSENNFYAKNEFYMFLGAFLTYVSLVYLYP